MSGGRIVTVQGPPDPERSYTDFPKAEVTDQSTGWRCHQVSNSPGWWSSDESGRFNLEQPRGTMYVADEAAVAFRESLGELGYNILAISPKLAESRVVTEILLTAMSCADVHGNQVSNRWGVTAELETMTDHPDYPGYQVPRMWAATWDAAGFDGIRYMARFSPSVPNSWAIFGPAGASPVVEVATIDGRAAAALAGYEIDDGPFTEERFTVI